MSSSSHPSAIFIAVHGDAVDPDDSKAIATMSRKFKKWSQTLQQSPTAKVSDPTRARSNVGAARARCTDRDRAPRRSVG
jgi:hypothetical protein